MPLEGTAAAKAGYVVDGGYAAVVASILEHHGISYRRLDDQPHLHVLAFRATAVKHESPFEGRARATFQGAWAEETRTLDRGAIYVPIAQPLARLIVHLFDPAAPDSLAQWGLFSTAFERKEYMEPYVAEEVARTMMAKDPAIKAQFDQAVAAEPLTTPEAKREWFYRRSPAWDDRVNLMPVYSVDAFPDGS